ncbi:hypothetical protein F2Q69_00005309 [Brassica cretica]|uniref:Uncharacterized protein n=1 Tax=Brassica cretica TaxID=69181 RepID=A0A8S9NW01_BRACR|nr:hypothetical protein F2Q69_00005309 [Brassica cretica]
MCQDVDSSNENLVAFTMFEETDLSYEFKMPPTASSCYYHMLCLGEVPQGHLSDVNEVPNHHDVLEAAYSLLTGHQDNPEFALAMCPTEPFVLSGDSKSSGSIIKQTGEGGDKSESPYICPRGVYHGHDDTVEDVAFSLTR